MDFNKIIPIKTYVVAEKEKIKTYVKTLSRTPCLAVVQVDSVQASNSYVKSKRRDAEELGIKFEHIKIDSNECSQKNFESVLQELNCNEDINGIIIQLPIPEKYNLFRLQKLISPEKDIDGFRRDSLFYPCTPKGIIDWLKYNNYSFAGKNAVVIGRSKIVGKPLVNMLIDEGATVTCCNSKTKNLKKKTKDADLVATAIGKAKFFDGSYFSEDTLVVDVGINRDENNELCGDVNREKCVKEFNEEELYITAVPGGVGLLTRITLMKNTIEAFSIQSNLTKENN